MRISILVLCLAFISQLSFGQSKLNAQKFVTVTGNVTGDTNGFNHVYLYGQGFKMDTVLIENSKFTFKIPYSKPCFPLFFTEYDIKQNKMYSPYGILVDGPFDYILKDVDLSKGMGSSTLSGSKTAELYQEFTKGQKSVYTKIAEIMKAQKSADGSAPKGNVIPFNSPNPFNSAKRDSLSKLLMTELISDFVTKYPDEYASAYMLSSSGRSSLLLQDLEKCYTILSDKMQKSAEGSNVQDYIKGIKNSAVGKTVENFILPDPAGKDLEWNSLKGKYILVDFWASWCGPCRQSFPHMRDIYKTYKDKNFEIYSISIDKDKAAWLKAVEQEQNPWLSTLDTKNISQKGFAVTAVPTYFLIGPDGKILLKEVGFSLNGAMDKKLAQIFGLEVISTPVKKEANTTPKDTSKMTIGVPARKPIPATMTLKY